MIETAIGHNRIVHAGLSSRSAVLSHADSLVHSHSRKGRCQRTIRSLPAMRAELERSKSQLKMDRSLRPTTSNTGSSTWTNIPPKPPPARCEAISARGSVPARRGARGRLQAGQLLRPGRGHDRLHAARRRHAGDAASAVAGRRIVPTERRRGSDRQAGQLKQLTIDQPVDDFARADPVQSIGSLAKLRVRSRALEANAAGCIGALQSDPADRVVLNRI